MKNAYILFGKSGCGKGTQANLLVKNLESGTLGNKALYISTGAHLRQFTKTDSFIASITRDALAKGELSPEFLATTMWGNFLIENFTGNEDLILDGLARRLDESMILENALEYIGIQNIYVIFINTSDVWSTERLLARGRADDDADEIKKRLNWFAENTMQSINYFKNKTSENLKIKYLEINGEQTIEEVHNSIIKALENDNN
jgi:adenylate kinase family enzyme